MVCFMAIKPFQNRNTRHFLESRMKDSQQNLFEFTLMTAHHIDFSTFDVLSVIRADTTPTYVNQTIHRKVNTQAARVASQSARVIPWPKRR
jgi:hypothetical protein